MNPIYLLIVSSFLLLFQSPGSESIALSRLCGKFGHSCYGGNWGKRGSPENLSTDLKMQIDDDYTLKEFRLELFRQRLRQLFRLK